MGTPQSPSKGIAFPESAEGERKPSPFSTPQILPVDQPCWPFQTNDPCPPPSAPPPARGYQEVQARIRVGISKLNQETLTCSWKPGEPGVLEGSQGPRALRAMALFASAERSSYWVQVHLQHLHHPLVTTGTFNKLIQGQLPVQGVGKTVMPGRGMEEMGWGCTDKPAISGPKLKLSSRSLLEPPRVSSKDLLCK